MGLLTFGLVAGLFRYVARKMNGKRDDDGGKGRFTPKTQSTSGFIASLENSGTAAVLAYSFASISMTLVNKFIVSGHSWNLHLLYLAIQHIICAGAVYACREIRLIDMERFNLESAKKFFPVAMLLVFMIFTSNKALQFLSVPVYTIFKNLTVIAIAYGEVLWFGGSVTPLALMSFVLMVISSVVAAWSDFNNASTVHHVSSLNAGYFWMLINVFSTAMYTLSMRKTMKTTTVNNWGVIYYNNVLTIPVLLLGSLVLEDWSSQNLTNNFPPSARQGLIVGMIYSGLGAILISYCTAWCIRVTSSTTHAMVGALNKLPLAIAGILFFADPVTFGGVVAILMGFVSGLIYNVAKSGKKKAADGLLPTSNPMSASSQSQKDALRS